MTSKQVVLVTGCVSGIGLATATRLARDPDQRFLVIATVISLELKGDLVAAVGDALDKTVFIQQLDVTKDEDIDAVVNDAVRQYGRIDVVVNIAGICPTSFLDTMTRSEIEKVFSVNTVGVIRLTQAVLPRMKERKAGRIITVSSTSGRMGGPLLEIYCASKHATEGFFESLAPVGRKFNIWISCIEPGPVDTQMLRSITSAFEKEDEAKTDIDNDIGRAFSKQCRQSTMVVSPGEVADLIAKVIEAEKPVLRYPINDQLSKLLSVALADVSGETTVNIMTKTIE